MKETTEKTVKETTYPLLADEGDYRKMYGHGASLCYTHVRRVNVKSFWNELSLETRMEESRVAKILFKNRVIKAFIEHADVPFTPTNKDLAQLTGLPEHAVKRYLQHWKKLEVFSTSTKRFYHHEFGWCNQRTIEVHPTYVTAVRALIRSGKVI